MKSSETDVSAARVPAVERGSALVVRRYGAEHAVVVHPEDFRRLAALDAALAEIDGERPQPSDLTVKAHRLEDRPAGALEDADAIRALLGL